MCILQYQRGEEISVFCFGSVRSVMRDRDSLFLEDFKPVSPSTAESVLSCCRLFWSSLSCVNLVQLVHCFDRLTP
jgi:hypothetical protein